MRPKPLIPTRVLAMSSAAGPAGRALALGKDLHLVAERGEGLPAQLVIGPIRVAPLLEEARFAQDLEMVREERLAQTHVFDEVTDTQLFGRQPATDLPSGGIGECLEGIAREELRGQDHARTKSISIDVVGNA